MTRQEEAIQWPGTDKLKPLADQINRLLDERDGIARTISKIYREAKGAGYVPEGAAQGHRPSANGPSQAG